ncbi:MAG: hypothetical protein VKJ24_18515 [Synechococcales bacterium]|nr:hypothetical protein [Synechococcales bacterium]
MKDLISATFGQLEVMGAIVDVTDWVNDELGGTNGSKLPGKMTGRWNGA